MAKNQVVSIDIGTDAIKMVQLEKTQMAYDLLTLGLKAIQTDKKKLLPPQKTLSIM